jgi:hypothetical protein
LYVSVKSSIAAGSVSEKVQMSEQFSAFLEGRSVSRSAVCEEMYTLFRLTEVLFTNRMEKAKADQEELVAKCGCLIHEIESIKGLLLLSAFDKYTDKINGYCNRIEALHTRIDPLNRRADNLLRRSAPPRAKNPAAPD